MFYLGDSVKHRTFPGTPDLGSQGSGVSGRGYGIAHQTHYPGSGVGPLAPAAATGVAAAGARGKGIRSLQQYDYCCRERIYDH